jgi:arabinose-5-phosphate isomerase
MAQAVLEISRKGMGMTAVLEPDGRVAGIFTDGDLRRTLERAVDIRTTPVDQVMTAGPRTVGPAQLAVDAVRLMEEHRISQVLVVDLQGRLVGALNMHDLFRAKVI